jgi:MFS family permease
MTAKPAYPPTGYAWLVVGILMFAYIFAFIDRTILTLLVTPIRRDLHITDTGISLLHGLAFAVFYTMMGFPLGRLIDRRHRVSIISGGILIWSIMTAACGMAKNFTQLFLARMGVGVGEAALSPAAYSLIADYFPPHKLSRAMSAYVMGAYMGMGGAYIAGGFIIEAISKMPDFDLPVLGHFFSWQLAFFAVGLPGILIAALVWVIREPVRRDKIARKGEAVAEVSIPEVLCFVMRHKRTYGAHFIGFGCLSVLVNGTAFWIPTFMQRTYGWKLSGAGIALGVLMLVFGTAGVMTGGWLADRLEQKGVKGSAFITAILGAAGAILPALIMPVMPTAYGALAVMAPMIFFGSFPYGVAISSLQQFTPNEMRGQISALYLFFNNLIGFGGGPALIALTTDYVFHSDAELRYSMSVVGSIAAFVTMLLLWWGLRYFRQSLDEAQGWKNGGAALLKIKEGNLAVSGMKA